MASDPDPSDRNRSKPRIPTVKLRGDVAVQYVRNLCQVIKIARLNNYYPDSRALCSHIEAMDPEINQGLCTEVEMDLRSGLPTYGEWVRVKTDWTLAAAALGEMGPLDELVRKAESRTDSVYVKQVRKHKYYTRLLDHVVAPLGDMDVRLRRVDTAAKTAYFHVVLDKLDSSGLFVRFTIDLAQKGSVWSKPLVNLDKDTAKHTQDFQSLIYKFTSFDAEFTFFKLAVFGNLTVERVIKGTVGPVYFAGHKAETAMGELMARQSKGFVASFALDTAACDLAADGDNDPVEDLMSASLSEEALKDYEKARGQFGYKVFKDRKFVSSDNLAGEVRQFCQKAGTRNIIKTIRTK